MFETGWKKRWQDFRNAMENIKKKKHASFEKATVPHLNHDRQESMVIDIPPRVVARSTAIVVLVLAAFFFLFNAGNILLILFSSFLFAAALDPIIDKMETYKVPRALTVFGIYVVLFVLAGIFLTNVVDIVVQQVLGIVGSVGNFVNGSGISLDGKFGESLQNFFTTIDVQQAAGQLQEWFSLLYKQLETFSFGLINVLLVLVLTFFMAVEEKSIDDFFRSLFPTKYADYITTRMEAVKDQIGLWLRGQLLVSIIASILTYIGLAIMGIDYAFTLSLLAGLAMVIPVFGRFFAWIITLPIVLSQSPALAAAMSIYYLVVSQFENNLIVPYVMNKAVGLNPIIIIIAMLIGGHFQQIIGLVLAVPVATTIGIFARDYARSRNK